MDVDSAKVILRYEYERRSSAMEILEAFLSESPPTTIHLSWRDIIRFGHVPTNTMYYPYSRHMANHHPINLAAEVQNEDADVSRAILERVQRDINKETEHLYRAVDLHNAAQDIGVQNFIQKPIGGLPLLKGYHSHIFRQSHGHWYDPKSIGKPVLEGVWRQDLDMSARLSQVAEWVPEEQMKALALNLLKKRIGERAIPSLNHAGLAMLVRRCDQDAAAELLAGAKGIYAWLNIALQNPSQKAMIKGLQALSGATADRYKLIVFLRRPLTVKEAEAIAGVNAIKIINRMPWECLQNAVEESPEKMRAIVLKACSGSLGELMKYPNCLKLNGARFEAFVEKAPPPTSAVTPSGESLITTYRAARVFRKVLRDTYEPEIAKVILLHHLYKQANVKDLAEKLMTPAVARAAAAFNFNVKIY